MSFSSNSNTIMGRTNREKTPRDGAKTEPSVDSNDDEGPIDLSMPRYPNRKKDSCVANSYYAAGRRKQTSSYDVDAIEQPIDYSKKYVESNSLIAAKTNYVPRNSLNKVKIDRREREKQFSQQDEKAYPYGDYAETDLDQPTDYSLRYAEDDTDDEEKQNNAYFNGNEQEDTVKTYCTEGTPYETPFNVSSATSMSDLRLEDGNKDGQEGARRTTRRIIQDSRNARDNLTKQPTPECKENEKEEKEEEMEILTKESKNISNELVLNSSSASIEKPINYNDEGTPGRISRISSLSSLGCTNGPITEDIEKTTAPIEVQTTPELPISSITSIDGCTEEIANTEDPLVVVAVANNDEDTAVSRPEEEKGDARVVDKEGKVVTFGGEDHYAEQTPLMFSRSSSLGSLSGFEQHSIHDDRSSIVSDFSRRTSGLVSPSEFPDSPIHTVPPSPRHNQKNNTTDFSPRLPATLRHFSYVKSPRSKSSVFEDNVTAFKEESTPIEFSAATSLSSLTIDDEPKIIMDAKEKDYSKEARTVGRFLVITTEVGTSIEAEKNVNENVKTRDRENEDRRNIKQVSDGDEDEEDILAACISVGMRNSMYRQSCNNISEISDQVANENNLGDSTTNLVRYQTSSTLDRIVADVAAVSLSSSSKRKNYIDVVAVPHDSVRIYCTEDTPANISPVGSQSNLSALSALSISEEIEKDEGNRLSEEDDDDKILDDCIRAGIARTLQGANSFPVTAPVTEFNSPSHVSSTMKCLDDDDDKILDYCIRSGIARPLQGSNSFPGTAAATNHNSPLHTSSIKKLEAYLPIPVDTRQAFSTANPSPTKSNEPPSRRASSALSNSTGVDHDTSGEDDNILDDCIRAGIARTLQGQITFPSTAAVAEQHSPRHAASTKKSKVYLPRPVDDRQASSSSPSSSNASPVKSNEAANSCGASARSNSSVVDYDTTDCDDKISDDCTRTGIARTLHGGNSFPVTAAKTKFNSPCHASSTKKCQNDDKILDDCIRSGITRPLQGSNSFPGTAAATNHNSPLHTSSIKKLEAYLPIPVDTRQAFSTSNPSPTKSNEPPTRRASSALSNSTGVDHDTSGEDDNILDDCIRAGIARTLQGQITFASTAAVAEQHSPRHAALTKKSKVYLPRPVDDRQASSWSPLSSKASPAKSNEAANRCGASARSNSFVVDHDTTGCDDKISDDCTRTGIARTLHGGKSFPGTAATTKFNSPRHASSTKKCQNDDKILDDCIRSGITRPLQGSNSFPGTAAATNHNSPLHTSSIKKLEAYLPIPVDTRQAFSTSNPSPTKSNEPPTRRASSALSNSTGVDHDTSGEDDNLLDDCIRAGIIRTLQGQITFASTAAVAEQHSPRHAASTNKPNVYLPTPVDDRQAANRRGASARSNSSVVDYDTTDCDDKISDDCTRTGIARTLHGGNSFPGTAATTKFNSPRHASSTKKCQNDDKILDDCVRSGIARPVQGSNSFPGTAAATNHNSPQHTSSIKKLEAYLPISVDTRQAFSTSNPSPTKSNEPPTRRASSALSNSTGVDHDTSGEDDKLLDDCIRAGIARTLQGKITFASTAAVAKQHSPRHSASTKKSKVYLPRPVDNRQASSSSSSSSKACPAKSNEAANRRGAWTRSNSSVVDHDTTGCDNKISDDCTRTGIAKTMHGSNSFPGTASATKHNSPLHTFSMKKLESYFPKLVDTLQAFSISSMSSVKSNEAPNLHASTAITNSTAVDHDTSGEDDNILDDCIKVGIARTLQGGISFSSNASVTKQHSPRHAASTKKSKVHVPNPVDNRQAYSMSKPSPGKIRETPVRRASSARTNFTNVDHDTSGDDDKILDDCIRSGIARTFHGVNSCPSTAASTKHNSPRHVPSTKKSEVYLPCPVDNRQAFTSSKPTSAKSNDAPTRRATSARSNSTAVDHDTSGDDDNILDDCIRAGIARTLHGPIPFPSTAAVTKLHTPRHGSSTMKSDVYLSRPVETRQNFSISSKPPVQCNEASTRSGASSARSNSIAVDHDTFGDDDKMLDDCIRAGIARTLQGTNTFTGTAAVTKLNSPRHASSTKKSELYLPMPVDNRQTFSMSSTFPIKSNDIPIRRTSSPGSNSTIVDHDRIAYDDSANNTDDEAILTQCIQSAMPKGKSQAKPQAIRKIPKRPARNVIPNETSSCSSTRVTTEVFRTSLTRILIPVTNRDEETFGDNSSLSEDEEDLILTRCIRSGMSRASSMPPKDTNYQRDERRTREQ